MNAIAGMKAIISGGGTGGHIFPAVAIAHELKRQVPDVEILFVGALGRMEMEKIPREGFNIIGLPVMGFQRSLTLKNLRVLINLFKSLRLAKKIVRDFKPDVAVGVGGYASGPVLRAAEKHGIPCLLQEQNSYAGVTNKLLAKNAAKICVAYERMERFFPGDKVVLTGNPVRRSILDSKAGYDEAMKFFGLDPNHKTILAVGGSLGARTINECMEKNMNKLKQSNVQLIWQTGKNYYQMAKEAARGYANVRVFEFIYDMDMAFAAADIVISRAGAGTISELCIIGKPVIFVPSPYVAEDHQTRNAQSLVEKEAALLVTDARADEQLINKALEVMKNRQLSEQLSANIKKLAVYDSAQRIVNELLTLVKPEEAK